MILMQKSGAPAGRPVAHDIEHYTAYSTHKKFAIFPDAIILECSSSLEQVTVVLFRLDKIPLLN